MGLKEQTLKATLEYSFQAHHGRPVMPDPLPTDDFNHAHESKRRAQYHLGVPGVSINPPEENHGFRVPTTDDAVHRTRKLGPNTDFAYAANPSSENSFDSRAYTSNGANGNTHNAQNSTRDPYGVAHGSSENAVSNLNLASFGSQLRPATSAPFLDFAPQPLYEPTGELLHETVQDFGQFDDPSSLRHQDWQEQNPNPETIRTREQENSTNHLFSHAIDSTGLNKDVQGFIRPALKRNFVSDSGVDDPQQRGDSRQFSQPELWKIRRVSFEQMSGTGPVSADDEDSSSSEAASNVRPSVSRLTSNVRRGRGSRQGPTPSLRGQSGSSAMARPSTDPVVRGSKNPSAHPPSILPPEKVFPIQIGSELFRLSGASISSDAPSYFTQFFEEQIKQNEESGGVRTLYIDRDPETFRDVARHLQGYYIRPRDGSHFVKLFADAQFYSLPRLIEQLFEAEIFIQIGESHFQIPKDIFSDPGNSPNFFSLGFAVFFSTPGEVFPGLDRRGLLRPPSITPPYVPGRSAQIFAQLLHLLRGYPLHIEHEDHRAELLRDCRYFHLRGLEQKIIAHDISYNLERQQDEICLRIEDVKPSGVSYKADDAENEQEIRGGWVRYARPFVDGNSYELVLEIGGETTMLDLNEMRLDFHGLAKARISSLFQVIANKMNLPTNAPLGAMMMSGSGGSSHASPGNTPLSEDRVRALFEASSEISLNGQQYDIDWNSPLGQCMTQGPNKSNEGNDSDVMSEGEYTHERNPPAKSRTQASQSVMTRSDSSRKGAIARTQGGSATAPPRIDTAAGRKRRRPTLSTSSNTSGRGQWVIRNAQWRLRVQQNEQDPIRGGYEIIFMAVKVDAFSQERARNARRKFLGGGG